MQRSNDLTRPCRSQRQDATGVFDVVVWEADGSVDGRMGYGRAIASRLHAAGWSVATVPLTRRIPAGAELAAPAHVLSGGSTPVHGDAPWLRAVHRCLAPLLERALAGEAQVTGICFGSQLIATTLAGPAAVGPHGQGMQAGLVPVGEPGHRRCHIVSSFHYHHIHAEVIEAAGARITLSSERTAVQAYRAGAGVLGMQFHPELGPKALLRALRQHRALLERHGTTLAHSTASVHALRRAWRNDPWNRLVHEPIARIVAPDAVATAA